MSSASLAEIHAFGPQTGGGQRQSLGCALRWASPSQLQKDNLVSAPLGWAKSTELRWRCFSHQGRRGRQTWVLRLTPGSPLDFLSPPQSLRSWGLLIEATRTILDQSQRTVTKTMFYFFPLSPFLPCLCNYRAHIQPTDHHRSQICPSLDHQGHQPGAHCVASVRVLLQEQFSIRCHLEQVQRRSVALVQPRYWQSPSSLAWRAGAPWSHQCEHQLCDWNRLSSDCQSGRPAEGLAAGT